MYNGYDSQAHYEAHLIEGMGKPSRRTQYELFKYLREYFWANFKGVFFITDENSLQDIFQETIIKMWENIELGKIGVADNRVVGRDRQPLSGTVRTYFMGIARLKYLEFARSFPAKDPDNPDRLIAEASMKDLADTDDESNVQYEIIADVLSKMGGVCSQILLKFYYEELPLDRIYEEMQSYTSKDALKTKKYKCMDKLRIEANAIYKMYLKE